MKNNKNKKEFALSKMPSQLQIPGLKCFIRIRKNGKKPLLNENWVKDKQIYTFDNPIILEHITNGGNYAFSNTHGFFLVVDADKECVSTTITNSDLPKTFVVQSSEKGRNHFIWKCKDSIKGKKELKDKNGPVGDIRGCNGNYYTVCPGSTHPNGEIYKVVIDVPIADVSEKDVWSVLSDFTKKTIKKKKQDNINSDKIQDGERNNTLFKKACRLRDDKDLKEVSLQTLLAINNMQCEPPLNELEVTGINESAYNYEEYEAPIDYEPVSMKEVHKVFKKWLFIKNFNFLHTALAIALSSQKKGTPIWIIFIAASGDSKSEVLRSFTKVKVCDWLKYIDEITDKTLASGKLNKKGVPVKDLGHYLENKSSLLITKDLATLTSKNKDEKKYIWGKLRDLFDGFVQKDTGNEVIRDYKNIHTTWMFGGVPGVRSEVLVHQQLGTRELLYNVDSSEIDDDAKLLMAWDNENYEVQMRKEIETAVAGLLNNSEYNENIVIPNDTKKFIMETAKEIEILRAGGPMDRRTNTLINQITKAKPMRVMKQLKKFYIAMKSLNDTFSDAYIRELISHIKVSCGNPVRLKVYDLHKKNPTQWFTVSEYMEKLRLGRHAVEREARVMYNMRLLDCYTEWEHVGGIDREHDGKTWTTGGRTVEVEHFCLSGSKKSNRKQGNLFFYIKKSIVKHRFPHSYLIKNNVCGGGMCMLTILSKGNGGKK
jgi:hypothetical protein